MNGTHEQRLRIYSELAVKVGLNLQRGQRLLIIGPLASGGASLEAAPLIRQITAAAYQAGAPLVETLWGDEGQLLALRPLRRPNGGERASTERLTRARPRASARQYADI